MVKDLVGVIIGMVETATVLKEAMEHGVIKQQMLIKKERGE